MFGCQLELAISFRNFLKHIMQHLWRNNVSKEQFVAQTAVCMSSGLIVEKSMGWNALQPEKLWIEW